MRAVRSHAISPDAGRIQERIQDLNSGEEVAFYKGNSVCFKITPRLHTEEIKLTSGRLLFAIKQEQDPDSVPFVSKETSDFTGDTIDIELSASDTDLIPAGSQNLAIWWIDADSNVLTLYSGRINVIEDGIGEPQIVTITPDRYIRESMVGQAMGVVGLDVNAQIAETHLPAAALIPEFDGNLDADLILTDPVGTQPEISTQETDGLCVRANKVVFDGNTKSQTLDIEFREGLTDQVPVTHSLTEDRLVKIVDGQVVEIDSSTDTLIGQAVTIGSNKRIVTVSLSFNMNETVSGPATALYYIHTALTGMPNSVGRLTTTVPVGERSKLLDISTYVLSIFNEFSFPLNAGTGVTFDFPGLDANIPEGFDSIQSNADRGRHILRRGVTDNGVTLQNTSADGIELKAPKIIISNTTGDQKTEITPGDDLIINGNLTGNLEQTSEDGTRDLDTGADIEIERYYPVVPIEASEVGGSPILVYIENGYARAISSSTQIPVGYLRSINTRDKPYSSFPFTETLNGAAIITKYTRLSILTHGTIDVNSTSLYYVFSELTGETGTVGRFITTVPSGDSDKVLDISSYYTPPLIEVNSTNYLVNIDFTSNIPEGFRFSGDDTTISALNDGNLQKNNPISVTGSETINERGYVISAKSLAIIDEDLQRATFIRAGDEILTQRTADTRYLQISTPTQNHIQPVYSFPLNIGTAITAPGFVSADYISTVEETKIQPLVAGDTIIVGYADRALTASASDSVRDGQILLYGIVDLGRTGVDDLIAQHHRNIFMITTGFTASSVIRSIGQLTRHSTGDYMGNVVDVSNCITPLENLKFGQANNRVLINFLKDYQA